MYKLHLAITVLCCSLSFAASALAQDVQDKFFDTRTAPYFGDARQALVTFLKNEAPLKQRYHHFCVVGYENPAGQRTAWVHWREGQKMILWEGSADDASATSAIMLSRRQLDLRKHVVKSDADLSGSSFLVTRFWVKKIKSDCETHGVKTTINRPTRKE